MEHQYKITIGQQWNWWGSSVCTVEQFAVLPSGETIVVCTHRFHALGTIQNEWYRLEEFYDLTSTMRLAGESWPAADARKQEKP
ncbi:MAG: hypothetical protein WC551_08700 [Patescibacteria group bacterium]